MEFRVPPSIAVSSPDSLEKARHAHKRVFVGPMPEKVFSETEAKVKRRRFPLRSPSTGSSQDADDDISQVIKQNALSIFIRKGGKMEDWGEAEEQDLVDEMVQRWRDSEWARILRTRRKKDANKGQANKWVGGSFEIGAFLGVNVLDEAECSSTTGRPSFSTRTSHSTQRPPLRPSLSSAATSKIAPSALTGETYVTARSEPEHQDNGQVNNEARFSVISDSRSVDPSDHVASTTSLLRPQNELLIPKAKTESLLRPTMNRPSTSVLSDGKLLKGKGKGRQVHYVEEETALREGTPPAPPLEVLQRSGQEVEATSAGAAEARIDRSPTGELEWGDAFMRDRMLVRTCFSESDAISPRFDEGINRTTRNLEDADIAEYLVAWRKDRIELYKDHRLPGKEWLVGHKDLAFVIPLNSSKTRMSVYSFVDLTFCVTCPPTKRTLDETKSRWFLRRESQGRNIFIFKVKSRSRAWDWIWFLWRHLGGECPDNVDVWNPRLNTKVKIDVPTMDYEALYKIFTRDNVIALCTDVLHSVPEWKNLIERNILQDQSLQLAWRSGTTLDWIWLDDDIEGKARQWAVLSGLATKQSICAAVLEVRMAEHAPTYLHLKNGSRLHEPPAIEGFLERIKPNTQTRQMLYLSTHDGNLFVSTPQHAYPPSPPGLAPEFENLEEYAKDLRRSEAERGSMQIMHASGVNDLRSILVIRRSFHHVPQARHHERETNQDNDILFGIWSQPEERTQADEEDVGGEEGLGKTQDKAQLRLRRSFELLLTSGNVIRFEAHSCRVAIEWIERLRALVLYWKHRHQVDAKEEMELARTRRPRLTPPTRVHRDVEYAPEPPPSASDPLPALGSIYNWCILNGCKPVIKGGKIFMRKGLYGQFKLVQLVLTNGHLIRFRITPNSALHLIMSKKIPLLDAYVCSGYLAAISLPRGQYVASASAAPRRYQDGLEADDPEEDTLFMVWYHPHSSTAQATVATDPAFPNPKPLPTLSSKKKVMVFRTRSKLERDAWCWAINCEIERLVRMERERETKLREAGNLIAD